MNDFLCTLCCSLVLLGTAMTFIAISSIPILGALAMFKYVFGG